MLRSAILSCLIATTAVAAPVPSQTKASVLLVTLDTTRADRLGCYGAKGGLTPNIDAVARAGARFDRALSPVPLTLPAHATMMSGLVPRRHGVRDNAGFRLDASIPVIAERFREGGYRTAAFVSAAVLDGGLGLARGFEIYDDTVRIGDRSAFDYQERAASQTIDAALARLPELKPPFFLWVHLFDPHLPYVPPEPFRSRFKDAPYDGEIAFMDAQIGRLLETVRKKTGTALVVAIAGDHGESLGEHGEAAHGLFVYQATQHVPLILSGRGIPAGRSIASPVGLVDLAATLLDLAKLAPLAEIDGRSLVPVLSGKTAGRVDYEMETMFPRFSYGWAPLRALVGEGLKLVDAPRREVYDLGADPKETNDLAGAPPPAAAGLAARLSGLVSGDAIARPSEDPDLAEQRRRLAALGYVGGSDGSDGSGGEVIDPKDGVAWLADLDEARRALQMGRPRDGIPPIERLLGRNPRNVPATLVLGQCRLATNDAAGAEKAFLAAIEINSSNALSWFNLGNARSVQARGKGTEALRTAREAYERAIELDPRHADTYLNYASLLAGARDMAAVEEVLGRARKAGVKDPVIEAEAGFLALARGDATAARPALEGAVALDPRDARSLEALGTIAYGEKRAAEAAGWYQKALDARPSAALAKTLGSIRLHDLGDRDGARKAYLRAIVLARPDDPDLPELRSLVDDLSKPQRQGD